jgi:hypothetical protein
MVPSAGRLSRPPWVSAPTTPGPRPGTVLPLVAWRRPRNPIGWLFLAAGLADATSASGVQLLIVLTERGFDKTVLGDAGLGRPT